MITIGIDIGGLRKGFHGMILKNQQYEGQFATASPKAMADWCQQYNPSAIAVDAPCLWAETGKSRTAERAIYEEGIHSYYTPTQAIAEGRSFYGWVFNGMALYQELARSWPLHRGEPENGPCVFETFPHAVTCALMRGVRSAKNKRVDRTQILEEHGIRFPKAPNQDMIDAALCALTADYFVKGQTLAYGDVGSGHIIVPRIA
jgi:predicted RNase H-like nuclease